MDKNCCLKKTRKKEKKSKEMWNIDKWQRKTQRKLIAEKNWKGKREKVRWKKKWWKEKTQFYVNRVENGKNKNGEKECLWKLGRKWQKGKNDERKSRPSVLTLLHSSRLAYSWKIFISDAPPFRHLLTIRRYKLICKN